GTSAANFFTIVRGTPGAGLRALFQVPQTKGYTVSDIKIGGQAIEFGGQIAEHILMKLTGVACRIGASHNQPKGSIANPPPGCSSHPLFAATGVVAPEPHTAEFPSDSKTRRG